ncbi:hypothetical protein [Sphingomonas sp. PB4P5]|uniref:hypothetical protein n=1 Tax=Parasphingomonas puruogangriensis TaxID=3096155 RepID=UPI002FC970AC
MNWLQLGGSIAAILVLAGIAWALGLGRTSITGEADAMRAAEDALSGFEATRAVVGSDGRAALVYGVDGRVAVLKMHGAQPAVRLVRTAAVQDTGEALLVESGERLFGRVSVKK